MVAPVKRSRPTEASDAAIHAPLVRPVQVLVEGRDDLAVACAILGIPRDECASERVQVHAVGGKDKFQAVLTAWRTATGAARPLETIVEKVVILRDHDDPRRTVGRVQ